MAISYVGASAGAAATAVVPEHAAGDVIFIWVWRAASLMNPSIPSGYTQISNTADGIANCLSFGYRVATGTSDGSNTWTNATGMGVAVFRGLNTAGRITGDCVVTAGNASSTNLLYNALTLVDSVNSWVVAFGAHRSKDTSVETAPTGMTARASTLTRGEVAVHDTNGIATSWSQQTVAAGGTPNNWMTVTLELLAQGTNYAYSGTIESQGKVKSKITVHKVLDLGYSASVVADSVYSFNQVAGALTKDYAGNVAASVAVECDRVVGRVRDGGVEADVVLESGRGRTKVYEASLQADAELDGTHGRGRAFAGAVEAEAVVDGTHGRGRAFAGTIESEAEIASSLAKAKGYLGNVESEATVSSVLSKSKGYLGNVEAEVAADSTYALTEGSVTATAYVYAGELVATVATDYARVRAFNYYATIESIATLVGSYQSTTARSRTYVGTCELVSEVSSKVAKGKVYTADGRVVVELQGAYVRSQPTARTYAGQVQAVVEAGATSQFS